MFLRLDQSDKIIVPFLAVITFVLIVIVDVALFALFYPGVSGLPYTLVAFVGIVITLVVDYAIALSFYLQLLFLAVSCK